MFECETPVQGDWVTIVLRPDRSLVGFDANVPENVPARSEPSAPVAWGGRARLLRTRASGGTAAKDESASSSAGFWGWCHRPEREPRRAWPVSWSPPTPTRHLYHLPTTWRPLDPGSKKVAPFDARRQDDLLEEGQLIAPVQRRLHHVIIRVGKPPRAREHSATHTPNQLSYRTTTQSVQVLPKAPGSICCIRMLVQ